MAPRLRSAVIRLRCAGERGAQSLEWLALGSFVVALMAGATHYAGGAGDALGRAITDHVQAVVGGR